MEFKERLELYKNMVESYLANYFGEAKRPYQKLIDSMEYSLMAGGKRLRPALVLEFCRVCGGDVTKAIPVAAGVEMLHTYTLIHDDLPSMDNDDMRRGKPTNHKIFGEFTATLAGDALQAEAYASILSAKLPPEILVKCVSALIEVAGADGICGGQQLDMEGEGSPRTEADLMEVHKRKTAALIRGACMMGVACAAGTHEQEQAAIDYAEALGLAFQIRDDMLDEISTAEELGKPIGSDQEQGKTTFMTLFGLDGCEHRIASLTQKAKDACVIFEDPSFLIALTDTMAVRKN